MKSILFISVFVLIVTLSFSQTIKTDTIHLDPLGKEIIVIKGKGSFKKQIFHNDTVIIIDNQYYYDYIIDNYKKSFKYKKRDTISSNIEHIYIKRTTKISNVLGKSVIHSYIYFDNTIRNGPKGVAIDFDSTNDTIKYFRFINSNNLVSLIEALNNNMAFNETIKFEKYTDDISIVPGGSSNLKIELTAKIDSTRVLKNVITPDDFYYYGLHENFLYELGMFYSSICLNKFSITYKTFFSQNMKRIKANNYFQEILNNSQIKEITGANKPQ